MNFKLKPTRTRWPDGQVQQLELGSITKELTFFYLFFFWADLQMSRVSRTKGEKLSFQFHDALHTFSEQA